MDDEELLRYSRHILLPEIDVEGQERLRRARVLVVGLGGLGSPAVMYLAASGVGTLLLADPDRVELSNLQRQVLHSTPRVGLSKPASAAEAIRALNPGVTVVPIEARLDAASLPGWLAGCDLALDCSDNLATRYALNAACVAAGVPLVSAAALGWEGQVSVFDPRAGGPCYQCLHPQTEARDERACAVNGVASPVVGTIGVLQALEAFKILSGAGEPLRGELLVFDGLRAEFHRLRIPKRAACPACSG
ncbi:MAG: HesA/MoeB/ThiF family protein [Gammaproteobacteria bacterium]